MGFYNYGEFDGLTKVEEIELDNEAWQFYILGAWKDENGGYYLSTDSGCSCPIPWENHTKDDLTGPLTVAQAREEALSLIDGARRQPGETGWLSAPGPDENEVITFIGSIV